MSSISPLATKEDLRNVCDEVKGMLSQFFHKLEKDDRLNSDLVRKSHQLEVEHKTLQMKRECMLLEQNMQYTAQQRQLEFRHHCELLKDHQRQRVENEAKFRLMQDRVQMRRNERCLTLACFSGKYNEAVALMETPGININAYVLFHVAENHFEDGLDEESLEWWSDWVRYRNSEDETAPFGEELTPIAAASQWYHSGNLAIVRQLVLRGADIEARGCWRGWRGATPLILAVKTRGMDSMVAFLLASGASTKATSEDGNTALLSAASCGQCSHAFQLLANPCDVRAANNFGYTALHYACLNRQVNLVEKLLEFSEVNVNALTKEGQSPLILASGSPLSAQGMVQPQDCIARLLAAKANVHIATKGDKITALHKAAQYADLESCRLLLAHGSDLFAKDSNGLTPYDHYASPLPAFAFHYPSLEFLATDAKDKHLALLLSFRHDYQAGPLLFVLRCGRYLPSPHIGPRGNWKCTKECSARQRVFCDSNLVGLVTAFL
jgi:ankyrin repeat protein